MARKAFHALKNCQSLSKPFQTFGKLLQSIIYRFFCYFMTKAYKLSAKALREDDLLDVESCHNADFVLYFCG